MQESKGIDTRKAGLVRKISAGLAFLLGSTLVMALGPTSGTIGFETLGVESADASSCQWWNARYSTSRGSWYRYSNTIVEESPYGNNWGFAIKRLEKWRRYNSQYRYVPCGDHTKVYRRGWNDYRYRHCTYIYKAGNSAVSGSSCTGFTYNLQSASGSWRYQYSLAGPT